MDSGVVWSGLVWSGREHDGEHVSFTVVSKLVPSSMSFVLPCCGWLAGWLVGLGWIAIYLSTVSGG